MIGQVTYRIPVYQKKIVYRSFIEVCPGWRRSMTLEIVGKPPKIKEVTYSEHPPGCTEWWKFGMSLPHVTCHREVKANYWIWYDPCFKEKYAYVDEPPPMKLAPPGYGYTYAGIVTPEGPLETIVDEPGYPDSEVIEHIYGDDVVFIQDGTVSPVVSPPAKIKPPDEVPTKLTQVSELLKIGLIGSGVYVLIQGFRKKL